MRSLNRHEIIGNLGKDPELRSTSSGKQVCNFSIATTDNFTSAEGVKTSRTDWHNIVAWGRLADVCGQYLHKGDRVYLCGKSQTRKWEDKEGNARYSTEIVVSEMIMCGGGQHKTSEDDDFPG